MKFKWVSATDGSATFSHLQLGEVSDTYDTTRLSGNKNYNDYSVSFSRFVRY